MSLPSLDDLPRESLMQLTEPGGRPSLRDRTIRDARRDNRSTLGLGMTQKVSLFALGSIAAVSVLLTPAGCSSSDDGGIQPQTGDPDGDRVPIPPPPDP